MVHVVQSHNVDRGLGSQKLQYQIAADEARRILLQKPVLFLNQFSAWFLSFLSVLCRVNQIQLSDLDVISIAKRAENEYVGVSSGKLDQSCEVYCRKDHLLYLDTADDSYERISASGAMKPYKIAFLFRCRADTGWIRIQFACG